MLAKWPVLAEEWAREVERRRTQPAADQSGEAGVSAPGVPSGTRMIFGGAR